MVAQTTVNVVKSREKIYPCNTKASSMRSMSEALASNMLVCKCMMMMMMMMLMMMLMMMMMLAIHNAANKHSSDGSRGRRLPSFDMLKVGLFFILTKVE